MNRLLQCLLWLMWLTLATLPPLLAQDAAQEPGGSSSEVEESDEAYRRRMELEDARQRNLGYTLPPESYAAKQEKLDKLPEESRDNIRDQLVDIIVENGDWEPSDALKEYPYEPTAAARADPELMQQEQEAWDEQIEKYHKREAAAYGTYLGPVPGPGNPNGQEGKGAEGAEQGSGQGSDQGGGQQGSGEGAEQGEQDGALDQGQQADDASAGTYQPYRPNHTRSEEEVSTAGVQQSALDFLKGLQSQEPTPGADPAAAPAGAATSPAPAESGATSSAPPSPQAAAEPSQQDTEAAENAQAQAQPQSQAEAESEATDETAEADDTVEIDLSTPGIIAIEDLKKLEGTEGSDGRQ